MMPKRRTILTLAVFLLLGTAVNIAVAWGCAYGNGPWSTHTWFARLPSDDPQAQAAGEAMEIHETIGAESLRNYVGHRPIDPNSLPALHQHGWVTAWKERLEHQADWCFPHFGTCGYYAAGWPALSFSGVLAAKRSDGRVIAFGGIAIRDSAGEDRILPIRPIWTGIALNTLAYALFVRAVWGAPLALLRMHRHRRGRCRACGCPVGASEACTACGRPVRQRMGESLVKASARRIGVLLLLSAAANVAVAWTLVYSRSPDLDGAMEKVGGRFEGPDIRYLIWYVSRREAIGSTLVQSSWLGPAGGGIGGSMPPDPPEPLLPMWALELSPMQHEPIRDSRTRVVARADGWPLPSLQGLFGEVELVEGNRVRTFSRTAIKLPTSSQSPSIAAPLLFLPYGPMWPGFAINTVFYAAICWLLFAAPFALRRLRGGRRIKRGLCPACAYPVGVSDLCTECGTPKPVRATLMARSQETPVP